MICQNVPYQWPLFLQYVPDREHRGKVNEIIKSKEVLGVAGELLMALVKMSESGLSYRNRRIDVTKRKSRQMYC